MLKHVDRRELDLFRLRRDARIVQRHTPLRFRLTTKKKSHTATLKSVENVSIIFLFDFSGFDKPGTRGALHGYPEKLPQKYRALDGVLPSKDV